MSTLAPRIKLIYTDSDMNRKTRRILFIGLTTLFLIITPSLIFYSQGWRIDFQTRSFTRTGGLYIKAVPNSAEVYIEGKLTTTTNFLFGTTLLENLLPDIYHISVQKQGYITWEKILQTAQHEVTEAKNIILFPDSVSFKSIVGQIRTLWPSPNEKEVLLQRTMPNTRWELIRLNLSNNEQVQLLKQTHQNQELQSVQWGKKGERVILRLGIGETIEHRIISFEGSESSACRETECTLSYLENITNILFNPTHPTRIIATKQDGTSLTLLEADYETEEIVTFFTNNAVAFGIRNSDLIWLDGKGILWKQNLSSDALAEQINEVGFPIKREVEYKLHLLSNEIFLQEYNTLFVLKEQREFQNITGEVSELRLSPDNKKLGILTNTEILLYFLQEENDQPKHNKGDLIFLTRFSEPVSSLQWIGSSHVVFSLANKTTVAEIDNRGSVNTTILGEFNNPQLFVQQARSILYVLSKGTLSASERLVR